MARTESYMGRSGFVSVLTIVVLLVGATQASRQSAASSRADSRDAVDVSKLGPQVGQRVPDFSLNDQTGKTWTLQAIMGPRGAMLVFYRSADW